MCYFIDPNCVIFSFGKSKQKNIDLFKIVILFQIYDKCFTNFFQKFISPDYSPANNSNPCEQLHESYRKCVEQVSV